MSLDELDLFTPTTGPTHVGSPRACTHPRRDRRTFDDGTACGRCGRTITAEASKRGRGSRNRGVRAELTVARTVGGQKMGQLGLPWDVEMAGYARLQVRKYQRPPSLLAIATELQRIALHGSGETMPGFVWLEPGQGKRGEQLIVFRLRDFAERHGVTVEGEARTVSDFDGARLYDGGGEVIE